MYRSTSDNYSPISDDINDSLTLHQRPERRASAIAIFVHGLTSRRYAAWGNFPKLLFEEFVDLDVGLYDYRTAQRRRFFAPSVELGDEAEVLADILRDDLKSYDRIFLLGHSMGGLLIKAAIAKLINDDSRAVMDRLSHVFLIGSPQAGSQMVPRLFGRTTPDMRALQPHGPFVRGLAELFSTRTALDPMGLRDGKFLVSVHAVRGNEDLWADKFSAGLSLPSDRIKTVSGPHGHLARPEREDDDVYRWVADRVSSGLRDVLQPKFIVTTMSPAEAVRSIRQRSPKYPAFVLGLQAIEAPRPVAGSRLTVVVETEHPSCEGDVSVWCMGRPHASQSQQICLEQSASLATGTVSFEFEGDIASITAILVASSATASGLTLHSDSPSGHRATVQLRWNHARGDWQPSR